jgi:ribosomal protein S27AE
LKKEEFNKVKEADKEENDNWSDLMQATHERASQVEKVTHKLLKPRGLIRKKCPKCGERLAVWSDGFYKYYLCRKCHYEYAKMVTRAESFPELFPWKKGGEYEEIRERREDDGYFDITLEELEAKHKVFCSKYNGLPNFNNFIRRTLSGLAGTGSLVLSGIGFKIAFLSPLNAESYAGILFFTLFGFCAAGLYYFGVIRDWIL